MAGLNKSEFTNPVVNWIDTRLPIFTMMQTEYGTSRRRGTSTISGISVRWRW